MQEQDSIYHDNEEVVQQLVDEEQIMIEKLNQTRMHLAITQQETGVGSYGPRAQAPPDPVKVSPVKVFRPSDEMMNQSMSKSMMGDDFNDRFSLNKSIKASGSAQKNVHGKSFSVSAKAPQ